MNMESPYSFNNLESKHSFNKLMSGSAFHKMGSHRPFNILEFPSPFNFVGSLVRSITWRHQVLLIVWNPPVLSVTVSGLYLSISWGHLVRPITWSSPIISKVQSFSITFESYLKQSSQKKVYQQLKMYLLFKKQEMLQ